MSSFSDISVFTYISRCVFIHVYDVARYKEMPKWKPRFNAFLRFPENLSVHVFWNLSTSLEKCWDLLLLFTQIIISATHCTVVLLHNLINRILARDSRFQFLRWMGHPRIIINIIKLLIDLLVHLINVTVARNSYSRFWSHAAVLLLVGDKRRARQECCPQTHHHQHHHPPTAHPQVEEMEEILCNLLKGVNWRLPSHYVKDSPLPPNTHKSLAYQFWTYEYSLESLKRQLNEIEDTQTEYEKLVSSVMTTIWRTARSAVEKAFPSPPNSHLQFTPVSIPIYCTFYVHYKYISWGLSFWRYVRRIMDGQKRKEKIPKIMAHNAMYCNVLQCMCIQMSLVAGVPNNINSIDVIITIFGQVLKKIQ